MPPWLCTSGHFSEAAVRSTSSQADTLATNLLLLPSSTAAAFSPQEHRRTIHLSVRSFLCFLPVHAARPQVDSIRMGGDRKQEQSRGGCGTASSTF